MKYFTLATHFPDFPIFIFAMTGGRKTGLTVCTLCGGELAPNFGTGPLRVQSPEGAKGIVSG